jgi:hypothetical protein
MNTLFNKPERLLRHLEIGLFLGLIGGLSVARTIDETPSTWQRYFVTWLILSVFLIPVLLLVWYKPRLKQRLSPGKYLLVWLAGFVGYLSISLLIPLNLAGLTQSFFVSAAFSVLLLELLLEGNRYVQMQVRQRRFMQKFGLEKAIILSITLISVTLSAMAVSSLNIPEYHSPDRLLIGFVFDPAKIVGNFGDFLSFGLQFLLIYLSGYLFFYINSHFLVSYILKQRGLILYILSVLATIALLYPIIAQALLALPLNAVLGGIFSENAFKLENAFGALAIMLVSLPVVLALQWFNQNNRIVSLEKEKAQPNSIY